MSKSLGNVYKIADLDAKGIDPLAFRYFTYSSNYTNKLNFTWDSLKAAFQALTRLRELTLKHKDGKAKIAKDVIEGFRKSFKEAVDDDLNMPVAMSVVWEVAKYKEKSNELYLLLKEFDSVLSIDIDKENNKVELDIPDEIKEILVQRKKAREDKDYSMSDKLRDLLLQKGYVVKDSKEGQKIERA